MSNSFNWIFNFFCLFTFLFNLLLTKYQLMQISHSSRNEKMIIIQRWMRIFNYKITLPSCNVFSAAVVWMKFHSFSARRALISDRSRSCWRSPIRLFSVKISLFLPWKTTTTEIRTSRSIECDWIYLNECFTLST